MEEYNEEDYQENKEDFCEIDCERTYEHNPEEDNEGLI